MARRMAKARTRDAAAGQTGIPIARIRCSDSELGISWLAPQVQITTLIRSPGSSSINNIYSAPQFVQVLGDHGSIILWVVVKAVERFLDFRF